MQKSVFKVVCRTKAVSDGHWAAAVVLLSWTHMNLHRCAGTEQALMTSGPQ